MSLAVEREDDNGELHEGAILSIAGAGSASKCLRVCVGVRAEGFNGIETYAEQVALAALSAGHDVTLLVTSPDVAKAVQARAPAGSLRVVDVGLKPASRLQELSERLVPQLQTARVGQAMRRALRKEQPFDVVHLNRPALAPWVEPRSGRLFVTGWFYPHAPGPRLLETWRHTHGQPARRLVLAVKSLAYYAGDARGYGGQASVVACTETLAAQLRAQGLRAVTCPPPVADAPAETAASPAEDGELRLLVCSGDLSHPRKNLRDAVQAAGILAQSGRSVVLRAIGKNDEVLRYEARNLPSNARLLLLGPKSPLEVRAEMRRAHMFVLPSLYEEWGYVAVEAILSGTPVATYPVYPFEDMLQGGLGVVAERIAPEALAKAIEDALQHCPRGDDLSRIGKQRFGSAAIGARLTQIWLGSEVRR